MSIILCDRTGECYFDNLRGNILAFTELTTAVKIRFMTVEHERTLMCEWDSITIIAAMAENVGKSPKFILEEVVGRMHELQSTMPTTY